MKTVMKTAMKTLMKKVMRINEDPANLTTVDSDQNLTDLLTAFLKKSQNLTLCNEREKE